MREKFSIVFIILITREKLKLWSLKLCLAYIRERDRDGEESFFSKDSTQEMIQKALNSL